MINYIIFSERKKLADEYEEWVNKPLEDGSKIKDCALSVVTFMTSKGYRKIPEDAFVLTREEYEKLQALKFDYVKGYEAGVDEGWDNAVMQTAEKFAEMLKERYVPLDEWDEISIGSLHYEIDEICKEIKDNVFKKGGDENAERYDCEL